MKWALMSLWALAMGALFVGIDPNLGTVDGHIMAILRATAACVAWMMACLGAGGALLHWLSPRTLSSEMGGLHALAVGALLWGLLLMIMAVLGALNSIGFVVVAALMGSGWLWRPPLRGVHLPSPTLAAMAVMGMVGMVDALAPPANTDELYYHLALPAEMLQQQGLLGGFLRPDGSRPMLLHLPFAALMSAGGEMAPRLFHLGLSMLLPVALVGISRQHLNDERAGVWAGWLLVGSWSVIHGVGLAANNLPTALAVLLTLDAALRGDRRLLPLLAGLALSWKYTSAGAMVGIWLVANLPWRARITAGLLALAVVSPWWLINWAGGLHPLFPFAGWPVEMPFQYLEKYGFGRSPLDLMLLPYRAIMHADIHSFQLLGRLSPAFAAALPVALLMALRHAAARRLGVVAVVVVGAWALGPHWLRHLIPGLPIVALALSAGLQVLPRHGLWAVGLCLAMGLPANWGPMLPTLADRFPAAMGQETRDDYLTRTEETWPAMRWANDHLPTDARVAILYAWTGYLLDRPIVFSSVEDHIPVRHWLMRHQENSLQALRDAGVTHLAVGRTLPIAQVYPFLSPEEFSRDFEEPSKTLEELLLREAILLYEENRLRIYRLR